MRFNSILLIRPADSNIAINDQNLPLPIGLGYLEQALTDHGIKAEIYDMFLDNSLEALSSKINSSDYDLIGVSINSYLYKSTYSMINYIKKIRSDIKIVVGGPHVTILREKVLQECPSIDYGLVGEGENTLVELCDSNSLEQIDGLIYRKDGTNIFFDSHITRINNLDILNFPHYKDYYLDKYPNAYLPIITSRGCPYNCIFCSVRYISGKPFRERSSDNVVDEIEYWYKKGRTKISILDDNFCFNNARVEAICKEITRRQLDNLSLSCSTGLRADSINLPLLKMLQKIGLKSLAIGVETGNGEVLKKAHKGESLETIEQAISLACDLGIDTKLFFIIGLPGETRESIEDSFKLAQKYPVADVNFYHATPYPGTELFDWATQNGNILVDTETLMNEANILGDQPIFETSDFTFQERVDAMKKAIVIEHEVTKKWMLSNDIQHIKECDLLATMRVSREIQSLFNGIKKNKPRVSNPTKS